MITGEKISAEDLARYGVLSAVVDTDEELESVTKKYVEEIINGAPNVISEIKKLTNYVSSHSHELNVKQAQEVFDRTIKSEEAAYGVSCFLQKKKPDWSQLQSKL